MDLKKLKYAQADFNRKYGVDFSIEKFDSSLGGLLDFGGEVDIDEKYRASFSELYKQAYGAFIDRKTKNSLDLVQMINDFDADIMVPYSEMRRADNKSAPTAYGGWTVSEYLGSVKNYLNSVPDDKQDFAESRYRDGALNVGNIAEYTDNVIKSDDASASKLATLYCYYTALDRVNSGRSFFGKYSNLFTHFKEQGCMDKIKSYIEQKTGGPMSADTNEKFKEVYDVATNDDIGQSRELVSTALTYSIISSRGSDGYYEGKERLNFDPSVIDDRNSRRSEKVSAKDVYASREIGLK